MRDIVCVCNNLSYASSQELSRLRLVLARAVASQDIAGDIRDLYVYSERLSDSYADEWRASIKRSLAACLMYGSAKQAELAILLTNLVEQKRNWYHNLRAVRLAAIDHAVSVCV